MRVSVIPLKIIASSYSNRLLLSSLGDICYVNVHVSVCDSVYLFVTFESLDMEASFLVASTSSNKAFIDIRLRPGIATPLVVVG